MATFLAIVYQILTLFFVLIIIYNLFFNLNENEDKKTRNMNIIISAMVISVLIIRALLVK